MQPRWFNASRGMSGAAVFLGIIAVFLAEPSVGETKRAKNDQPASPTVEDKSRVPVAVARERAKTMYDVYAATLDMMHEKYFHGDRAVVPARAMQDVFAEMKRQSHTEARWISVNLKPMSIDHEPKSDFEKRAAKELASGKAELEVVEDGYYRRAGVIPLSGGCISCHAGFFSEASTGARFAGLVISVPVLSGSDTSK